MFRNYLVTALRNILRYKFHAAVNIGGLALGLACVIFVILFVRDELSYDRWIPLEHRLHRSRQRPGEQQQDREVGDELDPGRSVHEKSSGRSSTATR